MKHQPPESFSCVSNTPLSNVYENTTYILIVLLKQAYWYTQYSIILQIKNKNQFVNTTSEDRLIRKEWEGERYKDFIT